MNRVYKFLEKEVPFYKFWDIRSGFFGGITMGCILVLVYHFIVR